MCQSLRFVHTHPSVSDPHTQRVGVLHRLENAALKHETQTENVQTSARARSLRFSPLLCCNGTFVILIPYSLIQYLEVFGLPFMQTVFSLTDQFTAFLICY